MIGEREDPQRFTVDDLVLDIGRRQIWRGEQPIDLPKLSFDLLLALVRAAPNVVSTDDLVKTVWGDVVVSDETLTQRIKMLRDALDEDGDKQRYIQTVRAVGYRLQPDVISNAIGTTPLEIPGDNPRTMGVGNMMIAFTILTVAIIGYAFFFVVDSPSTSKPAERSVAVLPFVAMSDGPDDRYFADGVTEEILNSLTLLPELLVTARTSSFFFKDKNVPVPEIGYILGVAHVVEGSIRRNNDQLRITAQLIRAADGFHVWSDTFSIVSDDIFATQIEIAEKVAAALDIVLDEDQRRKMRAVGVRDPEAFIAYQKGLELFENAHASEQVLDELAKANRFFERAIERVPEFSDAYLHHSDFFSHILLYVAAGNRIEAFSDENIAAAGVQLLSDLNAAVQYAHDDRRRLNAEFDQALFAGNWRGLAAMLNEIFAGSGCATSDWFDVVALPYGNAEASRPTVERSIVCNPLDFGGHVHQVRLLAWLGEFDAVLDASTTAFNATNNPLFRITRVLALLAMEKFDEADALIEREVMREELSIRARFYLAASRGDSAVGLDIMQAYRSRFGETSPADLIHFYGLLGNRENANRVAASADANPFGHMVLADAILRCYCGAPFDIEATPNFARLIDESGLTWPPARPIEWPLKTW